MAQLRRKPTSSSSKKIPNPIAKAVNRAKHSSFYHDLSLRGKHPLRLLGTPKDIWPGSVAAGTQIVSGKFLAAGHILENPTSDQNIWPGGDIWYASNLSKAWLEHLHSFSWLKDLNQAVDQNSAKNRAEELIQTWIDHNTQWGEISWRADIVGERVTNWLIYAPLIMDTEDVIYRGRVLDILARSARHLAKISGDLSEGPGALKAIIGLTLSGLYIPFGEDWLNAGLAQLRLVVGREVLVDGGIRSRNPQELLHVFMHMVLLRDGFAEMEQETPEFLDDVVSRMASNLKSLIHGDGKLPLFNGAVIQNHEDIYACLLKIGEDGAPLRVMEQSGFARLEKGKTVVLTDVGPPAEIDFSDDCHSGTLSFELSRENERVVVNSGDTMFLDDAGPSSRQTAAHSTLVLNNHCSSEIRSDGLIGRGVTKTASQLFEEKGDILLDGEHDGYVEPYGYLHKRLIYVDDTGEDVRGEDIIEHHKLTEGGASLPFEIMFNFHPNISVTYNREHGTVHLKLMNGEKWQFSYRGANIQLVDTVYFGEAGKSTPAKRIILSGNTEGALTTVLWSLKLQ